MNKLVKMSLVASLILVATSCSTAQQSKVIIVTAKQLIELQSKGAAVIDVRTPKEVSQGKIPGAIHVQLADDMITKMSKIDKNQPVIVYCQAGGRSTQASQILQKEGFVTIYNYAGSMNDWLVNGYPVE